MKANLEENRGKYTFGLTIPYNSLGFHAQFAILGLAWWLTPVNPVLREDHLRPGFGDQPVQYGETPSLLTI